ncbi:sensor domain-containing phosphodiesterase [Falsiroseomonas sp. HC035]|uniref:sensor domain-containing phosphodiesterase n=1 Tax=Falsiroseomonas sp. HC035 TaxID=3390999 RepID=UPI003D313457
MLDFLASAGSDTAEPSRSTIKQALEAVRTHLGMQVAYVSEFVDGQSVFREVDAPGLEALIKPGDSRSLDDVYCRHILAGRLPELMADTADFPLTQSIPITRAVPIGAHMSVPLRLSSGQAYGMFCCLSSQPNRSLNERDLQIMRVFADMAAHQFNRDLEAERTAMATRRRIEQVIEEQLFNIVYQPICTLDPIRVVGFEALCRFTAEPRRSPDVWFREAAAVGLGIQLELATLRAALNAFAHISDEHFLSVNASPETVASGRLDEVLRNAPLSRIVLEITEHARVSDYAGLHNALASLRKTGVKLAIDDAGAGYSSFQHILQLRPDIIKLDMSLTRSVDTDAGRRALASALGYFARETNCQIVAEGIESEAELATLRMLRIAKGQGYLLGKPADILTSPIE